MLAQYANGITFVEWVSPVPETLQIKACSRRLAALSKLKVSAKNQLHALETTIHTPKLVIEDIQLTIAQLENQIERLETHALEIIAANEKTKNIMSLLTSVKGIRIKVPFS